jgi:hypothetical protein
MKTPTTTQHPNCILNPDIAGAWVLEDRKIFKGKSFAIAKDRSIRGAAMLALIDPSEQPRALAALGTWIDAASESGRLRRDGVTITPIEAITQLLLTRGVCGVSSVEIVRELCVAFALQNSTEAK